MSEYERHLRARKRIENLWKMVTGQPQAGAPRLNHTAGPIVTTRSQTGVVWVPSRCCPARCKVGTARWGLTMISIFSCRHRHISPFKRQIQWCKACRTSERPHYELWVSTFRCMSALDRSLLPCSVRDASLGRGMPQLYCYSWTRRAE